MKQIKWILFVILGLYLTLFIFSRRHLHHGVGVIQITFYADDEDGNHYRLDSIPIKKGVKYGWESVCEGDQVIEWEDTLTLPEAPEKWPNGDDWQVSVDRLSCTRRGKEINKGYGDWFHKIMFLKSGKIEQDWNRVWRAAPGDPEGTYQLSVTISGKKFHQELKFIKTAL